MDKFVRAVKPGRIRFPVQPIVTQLIKHEPCIGCRGDISSIHGSIFGRILRGYMVMRFGKLTIEPTPPSGERPRPAYKKGRMCHSCGPNYKITDKAPVVIGTIQMLVDRLPIGEHPNVTKGMVELDDAIDEMVKEQDRVVYLPQATEWGRVRIPIVDEDVRSTPEPIHMNSFRKFMESRRGGKKDYDREVNFDNQKKEHNGDRRWFNRG